MASLNTSELQFAFTFFAKFNALNNYNFNRVIVPSTVLEGRDNYDYNGTDLVLDDFFFQFKMTSLLTRAYAAQANQLSTPYFRFDVKNEPTRASVSGMGQLDFLINHANRPGANNKVYYVTPSFDTTVYSNNNLGNFWIHHFYQSAPINIDDFCAFIDIKSIDPIWVNNDNNHVICYEHGSSNAYFFSEPKSVKKVKGFISTLYPEKLSVDSLQTIDSRINEIIQSFSELKVPDFKSEDNKVISIQKFLIEELNLFWLPLITKRQDRTDNRINQILA